MSEAELLASADFLAWCRVWEADRRCPLPMADWCLENVGELAFEACVWAHEKEERRHPRHHGKFRVMPESYTNGDFYWSDVSARQPDKFSRDIPHRSKEIGHWTKTFPAAIAYYLTHFDAELAKRYPPKAKATVSA